MVKIVTQGINYQQGEAKYQRKRHKPSYILIYENIITTDIVHRTNQVVKHYTSESKTCTLGHQGMAKRTKQLIALLWIKHYI